MGWKICKFVLYVDVEVSYFPGFFAYGLVSRKHEEIQIATLSKFQSIPGLRRALCKAA
jgi:hypothetical protein